jgi:hypothetical protein
MRSIYSGVIIAGLLCVWSYYANRITEEMVQVPDAALFGSAALVCYLTSVLLKADYKTMGTTLILFLSYYAAITYFELEDFLHDGHFPGSVFNAFIGFITFFFPIMFAGFMTWKYLGKKKNSAGHKCR